jgi:hypothetical protein
MKMSKADSKIANDGSSKSPGSQKVGGSWNRKAVQFGPLMVMILPVGCFEDHLPAVTKM